MEVKQLVKQIKLIKAKITEHEQKAAEYRAMLKELTGALTDEPAATNKAPSGFPGTMEDAILQILADGVPRTTSQLRMEYDKLTGKTSEISKFSARLIGLREKKTPRLNSCKLEGSRDNFFGKLEWFSGDKLKPEYLRKIE